VPALFVLQVVINSPAAETFWLARKNTNAKTPPKIRYFKKNLGFCIKTIIPN
jgi:hypothetical protein